MRTLKKLVNVWNRQTKSVNNHKIKNHKFYCKQHIVSKEIELAYAEMTPIYLSLNSEFEKADLTDLIFYERWLNE